MNRSLTIGLLLSLSASVAGAQELARSEAAWVARLGVALGEEPVAARFTLHVPAGVAAGAREASGVRAKVGALVVHRVGFTSAAAAHEVASRVDLGYPMVGEVRGEQLVVITGAPLRDPRQARRALDLAWRGGAPVRESASATFAYLSAGDLVVSTTRPGSTLASSVDRTLARAARYPDAVTWNGPADATIATPTGRSLRARRDDGRSTLWMAATPARAREMPGYLDVVAGAPGPRSGLGDVLDRSLNGGIEERAAAPRGPATRVSSTPDAVPAGPADRRLGE